MLQRVRVAAQQYQWIRERLLAEDPELDHRTLADTVEGLTDLHEVLAAIIRSALEDEALASGLKGRVGDMQERLSRLQERSAKRRQIARDVMTELDLKKLTAPDFTVSVRPGSPALVVRDERVIPERFFEPQPPRLNRQAVLMELKCGGTVGGAELSNGAPVLTVRTK